MKLLKEEIVKLDIGAHLLEECEMDKEEFLLNVRVDTFSRDAFALDYNNTTGELTIQLKPRVSNN